MKQSKKSNKIVHIKEPKSKHEKSSVYADPDNHARQMLNVTNSLDMSGHTLNIMLGPTITREDEYPLAEPDPVRNFKSIGINPEMMYSNQNYSAKNKVKHTKGFHS